MATLQADPGKFPGGIPSLVSYVHELGLKIGLYEDMGSLTCDGRAGSYGHYDQDAKTFAAWHIDYLKMDWCHTVGLDPKTQYVEFAAAMANAKLAIPLSVCDWGTRQPWQWAPEIANLWRTSPDIADKWLSVVANLDAASQFAANAGPGAWNDPDMLEVGNGGLSATEEQSHFTMWSMLSAPLIAGNDLTTMSSSVRALLTNPEVLAIDQDPLGKQAILVSDNGFGQQVWAKSVVNGTVVALLNLSNDPETVTAHWSEIGLKPSRLVAIRDLWARTDIGVSMNSFSAEVPSHGVKLLRVGGIGAAPPQTEYKADAWGNILTGTAAIERCPGANGSSCPDGYDVGQIGRGLENSITIPDVYAPSSGDYNLLIYGGAYPAQTYDISVNGEAAIPVTLNGLLPGVPVASGRVVHLNAGSNSIRFTNAANPSPNLDEILVSGPVSVISGVNFVYSGQALTIASPGHSATASIPLVAVGGFSGNVKLSCAVSQAMAGALCATSSVSLGTETSAIVKLTVTTTARGTQADPENEPDNEPENEPDNESHNESTGHGGTPAGTYPVTVTATTGNVSKTINILATVQ